MIGITGAMEKETKLLANKMTEQVISTFAGHTYMTGKLSGKDVCLTTCGIGKVNAAIFTQVMIDKFGVNAVINTGVAGGITEEIVPGDIVLATDLVEHDMDVTKLGEVPGQVPNMDVFSFPCADSMRNTASTIAKDMSLNVHTGRIVSGDQFIADHDKADFLYQTFDAAACEMEGAAIAHTCYVNHVDCLVIRAISDNARSGASIEYQSFVESASKTSAHFVMKLIENLEK